MNKIKISFISFNSLIKKGVVKCKGYSFYDGGGGLWRRDFDHGVIDKNSGDGFITEGIARAVTFKDDESVGGSKCLFKNDRSAFNFSILNKKWIKIF